MTTKVNEEKPSLAKGSSGKDNLESGDQADTILDVFVRTYNAADDPERGLLEHQKRRFIYQRLRPLAQEAYEYLTAKYSHPITQPTASASAPTTTVLDESSCPHLHQDFHGRVNNEVFMKCLDCGSSVPPESSSPPDAGVVVDEIEAALAEIRERRSKISPAPWQHLPPTNNEVKEGLPRRYVTRTVGCGDVPPEKFFIAILYWPEKPERDVADGEFIANAPTDIDWLVARVIELESAASNMKAELVKRVREKAVTAKGYISDVGFALDQLTTELEAVEIDKK